MSQKAIGFLLCLVLCVTVAGLGMSISNANAMVQDRADRMRRDAERIKKDRDMKEWMRHQTQLNLNFNERLKKKGF